MTSSRIIFNQYYYDLLMKIRTVAKKHKEHSTTAVRVLETLKDNYKEFDKTADTYVSFLNENCNSDFWKSYLELEKDNVNEWLKREEVKSVCLFVNITIADISKLLHDNFLCHHYISVFYIFKNELSDDDASNILKILQTFDEEFELENEEFKRIISRLNSIKTENVKSSSSFDNIEELKDTTIGKIAKEIINDVDITKLKETITNNDGNIFKALASSDSGLSELFTNVGTKVTDKISSGELNQEAIMKDAMKFAALLPGMFGTGGGGDDDESGGGGSGAGGFNMADMMKMMSAMSAMSGGGGGGGGKGKKSKTAINKQGLRNLAKRVELQKKLKKNKE
jgi:hypothetical protein